jgi:hypothetical protein
MNGRGTPPKYNPRLVERVILELAVRVHPRRLAVDELAMKIVCDPDDIREVETAVWAIHQLRESGLFDFADGDQLVEPTRAALRAHALLLEA